MSRRNEINADFQDPASNEWLHVLKGKNAHLTSVNIKAKYKNGKGKSRTPPQKKNTGQVKQICMVFLAY